MKGFGTITRIHIPSDRSQSQQQSRRKSNFLAFVDYATFTEAERAVRALHSSANSGLGIKAELANARNKAPSMPPQRQQQPQEIPNEIIQPALPDNDFITINLDFTAPTNENVEKVTQFEYPASQSINECMLKELLHLEGLAKTSKWEFEENRAIYNKKQLFLNYFCDRCTRVATLRDEKTRKTYCSTKCAEKTQEPAVNQQIALKASDKVFITAIISEKVLFVHKCQDDHHQLLENVYRTAKGHLKALEMIPNVDEEVIVKAFDDIFRAKILEILMEDEFLVQLTDIGNTARVRWEDLFEMTQECSQLPRLVARVTLKDVNVNSINMKMIEYLCALRKTELKITSIDGHEVELKDDKNSLVNMKIVQLSKVEMPDRNASFVETDLQPLESSTGANKKLFCINKKFLETDGYVECIEEKFIKDFYEFQKALDDYGQKLDISTCGSNINELCIIKIKDHWYRGVVMELRGNGTPKCILNDLFLECEVPVECIFPLPSVFTNPCYSDSYKIQNYMESNQKEKDLINKYLVENDFFVADDIIQGCDDLIIIFDALNQQN